MQRFYKQIRQLEELGRIPRIQADALAVLDPHALRGGIEILSAVLIFEPLLCSYRRIRFKRKREIFSRRGNRSVIPITNTSQSSRGVSVDHSPVVSVSHACGRSQYRFDPDLSLKSIEQSPCRYEIGMAPMPGMRWRGWLRQRRGEAQRPNQSRSQAHLYRMPPRTCGKK
jgi:hypothetical protein